MEKEVSDFRANACSISLKVAGALKEGSGFVYITSPTCTYNYVITAKHIFQESYAEPKYDNLGDIVIKRYVLAQKLEAMVVQEADLEANLLFMSSCDVAILKVNKEWLPDAKRIYVKNIEETNNDDICVSNSFPSMSRDERVKFEYSIVDKDLFALKILDGCKVKDIEHIKAISGSGIYMKNAPYLIGVISFYRHPGLELNEIKVSKVDWSVVNSTLKERKWALLESKNSKYSVISDDKEVINIGDLEINGLPLNLEKGIDDLKYDLRDDWFFDPLWYVDMCNNKFVLHYFSNRQRRVCYVAEKMEVAYVPKKTLVLRKAMIGSFIDRLVFTSVMNVLGKKIDDILSPYVFSARYNRSVETSGLIVNGVEQWIKMNVLIKDWLCERTGCLVKVDLLNYYDTINKGILIKLLDEIASTAMEKKAVSFLKSFLWQIDNSAIGLPQNCDASSLLASFYVSHVDEFMLARAMHYCRFMDDIYFVASDMFEARKLLQKLEKELRKIGLSLNAQKIAFVDIGKEDAKEFSKNLYTYDYDKQLVLKLIRSSQKSKRMNAIAKLVEEIGIALSSSSKTDKEQSERSLKFCLHVLSSVRINLYSYWKDFYHSLEKLVERQVYDPSITPLLCQILASLNMSRDIDVIKNEIANALIEGHYSYEWQAYNLWMLLAYFKYETPELINYAVSQIDANDETRRIEIAAIMIYLVTVRPKYNRIILHRLKNCQIHGYFQKRCALIACRNIEENAFGRHIYKTLPNSLQCCHSFLYEHKEKKLVFFHSISSAKNKNTSSNIFPEFYSGL